MEERHKKSFPFFWTQIIVIVICLVKVTLVGREKKRGITLLD